MNVELRSGVEFKRVRSPRELDCELAQRFLQTYTILFSESMTIRKIIIYQSQLALEFQHLNTLLS